MAALVGQIFLKNCFSFLIHAVVKRARIQHRVKHIVAGQQTAVCRDFIRFHTAKPHIILKKTGLIETCVAFHARTRRDDMQRRRFARTVSAIQHGDRFKVDAFKVAA